MSKLTNPGDVSRLLARHGLRLKKKWGQNFLVDENVLNKIVDAAELSPLDNVLEIGPGIGVLTQRLAALAEKVVAVEIDERLLPLLSETLDGYSNVRVEIADAMKLNYSSVFDGKNQAKMVANLPYNVATPLLYKILKEHRELFSLIICMVQKEVAERITAIPGSKNYGVLSVICQYASETELLFNVPGTVFFPRPDVNSAVVRLRPRPQELYDTGNEKLFFRIVEALFAQRRKTIRNTLRAAFPELVTEGFERMSPVDLSRRGETLNLEEFANLSRIIYNCDNPKK